MAGQRYIADPPLALRRVELDGLTALFHLPSGMTHIVAPPAPQILEALGEGPADASEILDRIKRHFDVDEGAEAISARLAELEAVGLVRTTCSPAQAGVQSDPPSGPRPSPGNNEGRRQ